DHTAVATGVGDQADADPGITRRTLDDDAAGSEHAAFLGILDDIPSGAVLDGAAWVEEFGLAIYLATRQIRCAFEANEGRIADGVDEALLDVHEWITDPFEEKLAIMSP